MRIKILRLRRPDSAGFRVNPVVPSQVVPSSVRQYLLPHEKSVIVVRKHPGILIGHCILLGCATVVAILLTVITNDGAYVLGVSWGAFFVIFLYWIFGMLEWYYTYFVVTHIRLLFVSEFVRRKAITISIREIHDLELRRSWLGHLVGYGTFTAWPSIPGYRIPKINYMPYPDQLFLEVSGVLFPDSGSSYEHEPRASQ